MIVADSLQKTLQIVGKTPTSLATVMLWNKTELRHSVGGKCLLGFRPILFQGFIQGLDFEKKMKGNVSVFKKTCMWAGDSQASGLNGWWPFHWLVTDVATPGTNCPHRCLVKHKMRSRPGGTGCTPWYHHCCFGPQVPNSLLYLLLCP